MAQHYTRNTPSAPAWCRHCKTFTPHKVWDTGTYGKLDPSHCIPCQQRKEEERNARLAVEADSPKQEELFA